jgi:hypothetical protein
MSAVPREVLVQPVLRTFRTINVSDCAERGPTWLVQGIIEQGTVTAVTGPPGSGKTFLLIDLAAHIADGSAWFGRKVAAGAVLYIAAEAALSVERRSALVRRVKFRNAGLPIKIVQEPALLGDEIHSPIDRKGIEALVDQTAVEFKRAVAVIVIDTVAASMGNGSENLDGMQRLAGAANMLAAELGVAVILNHHPNAAGTALRGHGSLLGTVSHGFQIDVKGDVRVLTAFKQRDAQAGALIAYRLPVYDLNEPDNFGDRAQSCVIEAAEIPTDEDRAESSELTRLTLAARGAFTGEGVVRFGEILEHCRTGCTFLADKGEDATRKAVGRALRQLADAGVIQRCEIPRGSYRLAPGTGQ